MNVGDRPTVGRRRSVHGRRSVLTAGAFAVGAALAACGEDKTGVGGGYTFPGARPSDSGFISDEERERIRAEIEADEAAKGQTTTPSGG